MSLPERSLGEVISLDIDEVPVDPAMTYKISGVYGFGRGLFERGAIQGSGTSYSKFNRLSAGKLVMSRLKAFEGALAVIPEKFDGWYLSQEFPTFRVDESRASVRYIANLCAWPQFWERLSAESKGLGARKERVSADSLLSIKLPLPELPEQRRIAARLDFALAGLRRVEELTERRRKLHEAFVESHISKAIAGKVEWVEVGYAVRLERRQVLPEAERMYREIGIRSFGRGVFHKDPISGAELGDKRVFAIEPGDLLLSNVFAWEGAVALAGESEYGFIGSHRFMTYRVDPERADASYLRHFLASRAGLDVVRRASPGSAGRNRTLGIKAFEAETIPLPPLSVQRRVSALLDTLAVELKAKDSSAIISALRPSLLNAAFSGQL